MFDVLSTYSIVYLVGDVADLMCNEGNKRKSGQQTIKRSLTTENKNN
jgi:hypothetical protein